MPSGLILVILAIAFLSLLCGNRSPNEALRNPGSVK
jgi:hypothetical protein